MARKHDISAVMLIFSLLLLLFVVSSGSFSGEYQTQTLVPTLLPARQTKSEALSWDTQDQPQSQYMSSNSLISLSLKLQHVDNLSPAGTTSESLFNTRLQRDARRVFAITRQRQLSFSSPVISGFKWDSGEYFTRIAVGSPPKSFYMLMDTGSHIIWLQCLPCKKCYKQEGAIFNPNTSTSFQGGVPCKSKICGGNVTNCRHNLKRCAYNISYGDGSFSTGQLATETLTFGKLTTTEVVIGCGHDNEGSTFVGFGGLLGLARDKQLSFLAQAGNKFGNKFSYCLANRWSNSSSSSYLVFGNSPACGKAVYTPLMENPIPEFNMFYYVGLEGISVGGSRVHGIDASTFRINPKTGEGGVIVDSGTVVTRLINHAYLALRDAFRKGTKHLKTASKDDFFDTCYHLSGMKEVEVPTVDLHFRGGATMSLPAANYMYPVDNYGKYCFAFAAIDDFSIIGNIQQQGFGVLFDVANSRLGFAPSAC